jgi:hypothetical protein
MIVIIVTVSGVVGLIVFAIPVTIVGDNVMTGPRHSLRRRSSPSLLS